MLKPLMIVLIFVILLAIGLNIDFSSSTPPSSTPTTKLLKEEKKIIDEVKTPLPSNEVLPQLSTDQTDDNLSKEILALFSQANNYFQQNKNEEAQEIYSLIIKKLQNNHEVKFIKYFVEAYQVKAYLFRSYPTYDQESSIEMLEMIIRKLENAKELELIEIYINTKVEQAYLQTKADSIEAYDQLLEKFKDRKEPYFIKKREELLLGKSFVLMGENDDEAMEILDELINKYQERGEKNIPENIKFSILNNIELAIITNNDDSNYRELANTYMSDSLDKEPLLDMLAIIRDSQELEQEDALASWQEKHNNYRFPDWSFDELRKWAYQIEDLDTKDRVTKYINTFENHKYLTSSTNNITYSNTPTTYNSDNEPSVYVPEEIESSYPNEGEEVIYEEGVPIEYEADPYANDVPVVYEDPYSNNYPPTTYGENPDPYVNDVPIIYDDPYGGSNTGVVYENPYANDENEQNITYEPKEY